MGLIETRFKLWQGDCLELMADIPDGSVDMVLADPPYGVTACKWDTVIPFEPMWAHLKRVTKKNAAIVMTATQPFTSALVMSNPKMFRYEWVWEKNIASNFQHAKNQPLKTHENVVVFGQSPTYLPVGVKKCNKRISNKGKGGRLGHLASEDKRSHYTRTKTGYPKTIVRIPCQKGHHPTQKPVALMEYMIKTYTQPGETVLDFTMGSGTTGVACVNTGRNFIGIELDPDYFRIATDRITEAQNQPKQLGLNGNAL